MTTSIPTSATEATFNSASWCALLLLPTSLVQQRLKATARVTVMPSVQFATEPTLPVVPERCSPTSPYLVPAIIPAHSAVTIHALCTSAEDQPSRSSTL